ncbi:MAG TPA: malto-oligosyltrehalose synthase [Mycobacteriales bacterium]|nr:malto-oligosyltrehalose synthase [Mycobacteriales bacterium]
MRTEPAPQRPQTVPSATYRVQLHAGFTLDDAAAIVPRLADLGITHLYCSPYLGSVPGSTHGYDVVDHAGVDSELGGEAAQARLADALRSAGLGQLLDIVPNHMAVGVRDNAPWWDVLKHGQRSEYARWFDIDWSRHGGRVLLPVLGDPLDVVLARGELKVEHDDEPVLRYYDHAMPLAPGATSADSGVDRALLDRQHYLLADWRDTPRALNYRRFFDVTTLAGLRVEDPVVFEATHRAVVDWLTSGVLDGVRVDHPDGLADPAGYVADLAALAPRAWIVVEKILEPGEDLPPWPVAGTTGYDALALVQQVLLDGSAAEPLTRLYGELTGAETDYRTVVRDAKMQVLRDVLVPEVDRLVELLAAVCSEVPALAEKDRAALIDTIRALLVGFPVYRTYVTYAGGASETDRARIAEAVAAARDVVPPPDSAVLDHLAGVLTADAHTRSEVAEQLLTRWQQSTGPTMAKGVEDTAFYRYHRLVALNEVGGDPGEFGISVDDFHAACVAAQRDWPARMTTLTTHDTKRSEDARARLIALAEQPERWAALTRSWLPRHAGLWPGGDVDRPAAYLLYQTLVAGHPLPADRAVAYCEKASREAKLRTSWTSPDAAYDDALRRFVIAVVDDEETRRDLDDLMVDLDPVARVVSLAQKLIQLTMPGAPDVYQGSELWDHSLVDPDNRRPVDHAHRERLTAELAGLSVDEILARSAEGLPKLHVVRTALRLRRERPDSFGPAGAYRALRATGPAAGHCLAFTRGADVAVVVPRLPGRLGTWGGTTLDLPAGEWTSLLDDGNHTGGRVPVGDLLARFPVALLDRRRESATGG